MTNGLDPTSAAINALNRIRDAFPDASGALTPFFARIGIFELKFLGASEFFNY